MNFFFEFFFLFSFLDSVRVLCCGEKSESLKFEKYGEKRVELLVNCHAVEGGGNNVKDTRYTTRVT